MSFRKYGGLDKAATNNIVRSHYSNSDNPTISELLGQPNSKIVSQSHLDFSGNSVLNLGTLYFIDGTFINTAGPLQPLNPSPAGSYIAPYAITLNNFGNITSIATQTDMDLIGYLSVNSAISGIYPLNVNGDINISGKYLVNGSELEINNVWLISAVNPNNIYYSNGTVGIGGDPSSSPYNLYVNGSVGITSTLNVSGTSTLGTINTGTATINGATTINGAATINGTAKITGATTMNSTLQVDGVTRLGLSGNSTQTFINGPLNINNTSAISGLKLYYDTNSYIQSLSNLYFTNINNTSTWMTITSSGLVGIGNPSPSYNLDVVGSSGLRVANGNSSSLGSIYLGNPAGQYASLSTDGTSNMNIKNNQNGAINWTTSTLNSSYLTLTSSGILKINNPPAYPSITNMRLNVNGDINFEGLLYQDGIAVDFNPLWISVPDSNNIYYDPESVGSGNGTVGIGLKSPNSLYKLDVAGAIHVSNNLYVDGVILNSITANPVNINNNLYVTTNNVGIGINPSAYKLDVNGIIHTNNNLLVDGSATVGTTTSTSTNLLSVNGSTQIKFNLNVNNNAVIGVTNGTTSNLTIWGSLNVITNTTLGRKNTTSSTNIYGPNSTDTISGALIVNGGVGISQDTYIGGLTRLTNTTGSSTTGTGALTVTGGVGIGGALNIGGNTSLTGTLGVSGATSLNNTLGVSGATSLNNTLSVSGITSITNITASNATNTGALTVTGGVGIGGALNIGGNARIGNSSQTPPNPPLFVNATNGDFQNNGIHLFNDTNTTNNNAILSIRTFARANQGNPMLYFGVNDTGDPCTYTIGLNNLDDTFRICENIAVMGSDVRFCIAPTTGNVGIGNSAPVATLHVGPTSTGFNGTSSTLLISEASRTSGPMAGPTINGGQLTYTTANASLVLAHNNAATNTTATSGGTSSILFTSPGNLNSDYGYIQWFDNIPYPGRTSNESGVLVIGAENDPAVSTFGSDRISLYPCLGTGFVGINTLYPTVPLDVSGNVNVNSTIGFSYSTAPTRTISQIGGTLAIENSFTAQRQATDINGGTITLPVGIYIVISYVRVSNIAPTYFTIFLIQGTTQVGQTYNVADAGNTTQLIGQEKTTIVNVTTSANYNTRCVIASPTSSNFTVLITTTAIRIA